MDDGYHSQIPSCSGKARCSQYRPCTACSRHCWSDTPSRLGGIANKRRSTNFSLPKMRGLQKPYNANSGARTLRCPPQTAQTFFKGAYLSGHLVALFPWNCALVVQNFHVCSVSERQQITFAVLLYLPSKTSLLLWFQVSTFLFPKPIAEIAKDS